MYVKNHGIPQDFVDSVFDVTRGFFDFRISQKVLSHIRNSDVALRGYIKPFGENAEPATLDPFLISAEGLQSCHEVVTVYPRHGDNFSLFIA
ncbi:MAG: hypothetical protein E5Y73_24510 [Mesorhizobium sp.]|uniref:2-oxoglutarate and iron-dependent oxygenase domain-containing protein n=1 Tax=Mesorhizobium sp. TaxID=1871066 RepID=UPI0011F6FDE3|nr:MAG: hypothetical protein E5Y73_24510 [Mesorhizobium sp.]TIR28007.1 MAG: hypothetical protein E5X35_32540 [Mesorhizobium sp.]